MITVPRQKAISLLLLPFTLVFLLFGSTMSLRADDVSQELLETAVNHIKTGIDLYKQSDFNQAISELNQGLEILERSINQIKATKELTNAHLHLGLAYIGVNNTAEAKKQFKEISRIDPEYSLDTGSYSQKVVSLFNEAKAEYLSEMVSEQETKQDEMTADATGESEKEGKPFYKKWWFWTLVVAGAAGIAVAASNKEDEEEEEEALFTDDFNDGNYTGWTPLGDSSPFWAVENGKLAHIEDNEEWNLDIIRAGNLDWSMEDLYVTISDFAGDAGDYEFFVFFGFRDEGTSYFITFNYGSLCLHHSIDWDDVFVETTVYPVAPGEEYDVRINYNGSQIRVYVNDSLELSHSSNQEIKGRIAFGALRQTPIKFDNVEFWEYNANDESRQGKLPLLIEPDRTVISKSKTLNIRSSNKQ